MNKAFQKGISSILVITVLAILVIGAGGYIAWTRYGHLIPLETTDLTSIGERDTTPTTRETPEETPSPPKTPIPLLQGVETYMINQSPGNRPRIVQAVIDPHEPDVGEEQTITVRVLDQSPVQSVSLTVESDNETTNLPPAQLIEGDNTDGRWQTSWTVQDTILYNYKILITAVGSGVQTTVSLPIRM